MPQAGYTPIELYSSTDTGVVPAAVNLTPGELALNITDGKLFFLDTNTNTVMTLATVASSETTGTNAQLLANDGAGGFANVTVGSGLTYAGGTLDATGAMVYPGAGIPNSTGSAWGTSYSTSGSGTVVALATEATLTGVKETKVAIAASNIDLATANYFTKTISSNTTFTVSNGASSGTVNSFILDLTNGGSATVNWWSGVKWASGTAPTLTASGRDVLGFFTEDGGTTWNGFVLGKAMA